MHPAANDRDDLFLALGTVTTFCGTLCSPYMFLFIISDEDSIRELLDNIPEVAKEFDVLSKIGEGEWAWLAPPIQRTIHKHAENS